jgi:hypothetical protein
MTTSGEGILGYVQLGRDSHVANAARQAAPSLRQCLLQDFVVDSLLRHRHELAADQFEPFVRMISASSIATTSA